LSLGLTDYTEFTAVESQFIWTMPRKLISIPLSKEQVMLEASLSLLEKRKLSKLLNSLSSTEGPQSTTLFDFLASEDIHSESLVFQLIAFGVCRCNSLHEVRKLSISRTIEILQAFKASVMHLDGRAGPFVVPCWGSSELAQAACRRAAVNGSIQMFNKSLSVLQGEEEEIEFKSVFKQQSATAPQTFRSCLLLNSPILGIGATAIVTIPPNCIDIRCEKVINILQLTSDSKCCPKGTCKTPSLFTYLFYRLGIIHLWSEGDFDTSEIEHNLLQSSAAVSCTRILWRETRATCNRSFTQPPLPANYQHEADFVDALNRYNSE
jgi:RAB protein geranylgeranyltransferase component A